MQTYPQCGELNLKGEPCKRIVPCMFHMPPDQRPEYVKIHWTPDEHILFLKGMEVFGRGKWKDISMYIRTKSQQQVKQHAKRYFRRKKQTKVKKHSSIHDLTLPPEKESVCPNAEANQQACSISTVDIPAKQTGNTPLQEKEPGDK
eukprot:TRINITY_DN4548_c0_g1_i1.p1 TRINITY_DN4548_c0_g1~~TRINITY_DN4548_c0_g1_i1.p1  ORF type:complete len:146 (+),score=27.75 TRINITY_DN4548_c0_g1_i1:184-621(+)